MKTIKSFKIFAVAMVAIASAMFTGCSSDDDDLFANYDGDVENPMTRAANATSDVIDFEDVPSSVMASDQYGNNLYTATAGGNQVTTGYHSL